jgi:hypothetical protein
MTKLFVTPLLATQRKKTKVAGETAQPKNAEVINVKKRKEVTMTSITRNLPKVDKKIKEKHPRLYKVWSMFIRPEDSTAGVLWAVLGRPMLILVIIYTLNSLR